MGSTARLKLPAGVRRRHPGYRGIQRTPPSIKHESQLQLAGNVVDRPGRLVVMPPA